MPDWKKIKSEYIRGGVTYSRLADKYNVSISTLTKLAMRERWSDLRKKTGKKFDDKLSDAVARREATRADLFLEISDKLLQKISEGIDNGDIYVTGRGLRDITGALRDLREINGIKSELDAEEQRARIDKLRSDAREESAEDKTIRVVIGGDAEDYAG